jgi:isopenicillin N synthase-like dioxygenase
MIPRFDLQALIARDTAEMARLGSAVREVGFLTLGNSALGAAEVGRVLDAYRDFFRLPEAEKRSVDMARTGANRGWGGPKSEQVDPGANPDFKEVFDCGRELPDGHPMASRDLPVYAPNLWPTGMPDFRAAVETYFEGAMGVAMEVLRALAAAAGGDESAFDQAFDPPMALLRGNYYPPRPDWAGEKDFGIAAHTDYGCLTLLATDGVPGLEVRMPSGEWQPVRADPGEFIINFGEMLEFWTGGAAKATLHRVQGGPEERISVPLFFNPSYDANVAPPGSGKVILAGEHLDRRFSETYVHLQHRA